MTTEEQSQAPRLYKLLREYLAQTAEGQELIPEIKEDPEERSGALRAYLLQRLPHDERLANQLAAALGEGNQFATVVTGGQVDQILNIARLGALYLDARRYSYFFRDVKQVIAFLAIVVIVASVLGTGWWYSQQPRKMRGAFNIAVAQFEEQNVGSEPGVAAVTTARIASFLDGQYQLSSPDEVVVSHTNMPVITNASEAEALAQKVNAHVVIYGTVNVFPDNVTVAPKFYVTEAFEADVGEVHGARINGVSGQHDLGAFIEFSREDLERNDSAANERLRQRTAILTEFTKALVYLASDKLPPARAAIENAVQQAEDYGNFQGQEVVYLFASQIARLQKDFPAAQEYVDAILPPQANYARAYIAQANIYYDQENYYDAVQMYEEALQQTDLPYGAYIIEKANLGLANVYNVQFQYAIRNPDAAPEEVQQLAQEALKYYQAVISSHQAPEPDERLQEMAALSYYSAGIIYQELHEFAQEPGSCSKAAELYQAAISLTAEERLATQAQGRLQAVLDCEDET